MVPYQHRQLVILSLPFAALVAFYWYKRRKSLSRSDPGGTTGSASTRIVDKQDNGEEELDKPITVDYTTTPLKVEEIIEKSKDKVLSSSPKVEINAKAVSSTCLEDAQRIPFEKGIGGSECFAQDNEALLVVGAKSVESIPKIPEFEDNHQVFHSTYIEEEKNTENLDTSFVEEIAQEELQLVEYKSEEKTDCEKTVIDKEIEINTETLIEKQISICTEYSIGKPVAEEVIVKSIKTGETFTAASLLLSNEDNISFTEDKLGSNEAKPSEDTIAEDSSSVTDSADRIENISTDTGLGSQDLSVGEDFVTMAQGQKTDDKTDNGTAVLEQKLASLGLDTTQPTQRAERDSANHSPAEVMLSSPAISTYSDAHSEGSSDSGKGCSDVITPSRTPAGGSSVAGDQLATIYEFVLPQVIVGRLIGRYGAFLQDIRSKTHTNVFIKRHPDTNTLKVCAIEGTQADIDAALKMIRQKFPLRRFPDLTLERVTFVKNSVMPMNPENLQLHLVEGVNNDVILSSLITAGHFFLQMPTHMSYSSLYRLACVMNNVYNTEESPPLPDPRPDVVCVAPAHGGWYRAQILSVDKEHDSSEVKFLDYGGYMTIDNAGLRQIRFDFLMLPFQGVECALANVVPAGGEEEWSEEAKQFVQQMTIQQTLQAQVYDYTETGLPLVYLYCTQFCQCPSDLNVIETRVVLLNQELVSRGYADLVEATPEEEQTSTVEPVPS